MSLYYNLKQCLHAINRLRQIYTKLPSVINDQLTNIETTLILCQCECADEEQHRNDDEIDSELLLRTYSTVLDILSTAISSPHALLQLYFSKSPHWEHYFCNITGIITLLIRILHADITENSGCYYCDESDDEYDSDTGDVSSYCSSDCDQSSCGSSVVIGKFSRKFIPMRKVALKRHWTISWRQKYFLTF